MKRDKYKEKTITLIGEVQVNTAILLIQKAPIDPVHPVEVVIRDQQKTRKPDQNALMWSGPLQDIAEQAWINGRRYASDVWHEHFKAEFLPEEYDAEQCKEGYRKWDISPKGQRVLVGSTTQLTIYGMAQYLEQVYAAGASMGVQFSARPMHPGGREHPERVGG
jgi:hypothetical protein